MHQHTRKKKYRLELSWESGPRGWGRGGNCQAGELKAREHGRRDQHSLLQKEEQPEEPAELRLGPDRDPGGGAGLMWENIEVPRIRGSEHRKWELQREEGGWQTLSFIAWVRERAPWCVLLRKEPPARRNDTAFKIRLGSLSSPKGKSRPTQGGSVLPHW